MVQRVIVDETSSEVLVLRLQSILRLVRARHRHRLIKGHPFLEQSVLREDQALRLIDVVSLRVDPANGLVFLLTPLERVFPCLLLQLLFALSQHRSSAIVRSLQLFSALPRRNGHRPLRLNSVHRYFTQELILRAHC